jgi:hypothetical protein
MSQRLGMQDGRCFTIYTANNLVNDYIMEQAGIPLPFNYEYRQYLQQQGPSVITKIQDLQQVGNVPKNSFNRCMSCDRALL